jgi:hypothetical protein
LERSKVRSERVYVSTPRERMRKVSERRETNQSVEMSQRRSELNTSIHIHSPQSTTYQLPTTSISDLDHRPRPPTSTTGLDLGFHPQSTQLSPSQPQESKPPYYPYTSPNPLHYPISFLRSFQVVGHRLRTLVTSR